MKTAPSEQAYNDLGSKRGHFDFQSKKESSSSKQDDPVHCTITTITITFHITNVLLLSPSKHGQDDHDKKD